MDEKLFIFNEEENGCCAMKPVGVPSPVFVFDTKEEYENFRKAGKGPGREYWKKKAGKINFSNYVPKDK